MVQKTYPTSYSVFGKNNQPLQPHQFNFSAKRNENSISIVPPHGDRDIPFIVTNPHSGIFIPQKLKKGLSPHVSLRAFLQRGDFYTDWLSANAVDQGAFHLISLVSPTYLNVGRSKTSINPNDVRGGLNTLPYNVDDPYTNNNQGQGLVAVKSLYDANFLYAEDNFPTEDDIAERIVNFYDPFHDILRNRVEENLSRFGYSFIYDVHSMPSVGTSFEPDSGKVRPDIIIGDNWNQSNSGAISLIAYELALEFQLSVRMNKPYFGGEITQRYARSPTKSYRREVFGKNGSESMQIEFNRQSFGFNENTLEITDKDAFFYFQTFNTELMRRMSDYIDHKIFKPV